MNRFIPLVLATAFAFSCSNESGSDEFFQSPIDPENELCPDPSAALPAGYRFIDKISTATISETPDGALHVDATAGGFTNYADNPFLYLSFESGVPEKVEITDVDAYENTAWDIALKRMVIRANGGDSGPGDAKVATTARGSSTAPNDDSFAMDDFATDNCELNAGQIGEPVTAFGSWYQYDFENNRVKTDDRTFIIQRQNRTVRLEFENYYGVNGNSDGANYIIRWSVE